MPWIRKGPWDPEEDKLLLPIVAEHGLNNWGRVSHLVQTRTPKQCTERYTQHLKGGLDHSALTKHECNMVESLVTQHGTCWAHISTHLRNRSASKIKNWWYNTRSKRQRRSQARRPGSGYWMGQSTALEDCQTPFVAITTVAQPCDTATSLHQEPAQLYQSHQFIVPYHDLSPVILSTQLPASLLLPGPDPADQVMETRRTCTMSVTPKQPSVSNPICHARQAPHQLSATLQPPSDIGIRSFVPPLHTPNNHLDTLQFLSHHHSDGEPVYVGPDSTRLMTWSQFLAFSTA